MDSIKHIYKIGKGPSSSHTMGPNKAAKIFHSRNENASSFRVTLYGSLAATGKGHMTDIAVKEGLSPQETEIVWRADIVPEYHTNGMLFEAIDDKGNVYDTWQAYSIGGGFISDGTKGKSEGAGTGIYELSTCTQIKKAIAKEGLSFWEYVENREGDDIWEYLQEIWDTMKKCVADGIADNRILPGGLHVRSKAKQYLVRAASLRPALQNRALVCAYTLAVSEQNARGGIVVTAPTCGACGVLPGVLYFLQKHHDVSDDDIKKALATAGLFGNLIHTNASISGAEVGCQGEVGSACVMAAVAITQIFGGTIHQIEAAAEMAMEHNLGLTCDPICGLVQIPCIERNAMAALRSLDVSLYNLLNDGNCIISFDKVVDTMKRTGNDLPSLYKETSDGGLATLDLEN